MNVGTRFLFGMVSGAGAIVIKTALNILLIPIMLTMLGTDAFGLFVLLISLVEFSLLLDLGITDAFIKLLGDATASREGRQADDTDLEREKAILKVGHMLFAALGALFLAVGLALAPFLPGLFHVTPKLMPVAQIALPLIMLEGALTLYSSYYRAVLLTHCLHQWANVGDTLYHVTSNLASVLLLLAGYDLVAVVLVRLIAAVLRALMMVFHAVRINRAALINNAALCGGTLKELTHLGAHAMMINFSILISHKIDVFVIAYFLPLSAVGIYEIVFRFLGITSQIALKLNEGVWPMFTRLVALGQKAEARQLFLRMSCFLNFMVSLMLMVIVTFYADLFKIFSAGKIPLEATLPLLILVVPCMWSGALQMPAGAYLFMSGRQRYLTVSSILAAVANFVLSFLLVQLLGIIGVAIGTLIPQLIQHQASLIREACKDLEISFNQYMRSVHVNNFIPLTVAFGCLMVCKPMLAIVTVTPVVTMAAIALVTGLIASLLWLILTGSAMEKKLFMLHIIYPLQYKRTQKLGPAHGT